MGNAIDYSSEFKIVRNIVSKHDIPVNQDAVESIALKNQKEITAMFEEIEGQSGAKAQIAKQIRREGQEAGAQQA